MNARNLAAAAFAVLGVHYLGAWIAGLIASAAVEGLATIGRGILSGAATPALALIFLLARSRLANLVAGVEISEPEPAQSATPLQLLGITLVGAWLAANGMASLVEGCLDTFFVPAHDRDFASSTFLRRNTWGIATTAIGLTVFTNARVLHDWLERKRA